MQVPQLSIKCERCDIVLAGRLQFVGHLIHSHDMPLDEAEAEWQRRRRHQLLA